MGLCHCPKRVIGISAWRITFALFVLSVSFKGAVSLETALDTPSTNPERDSVSSAQSNAEPASGETWWSAGGWLSLGSWFSSWETKGSAMASRFRLTFGNVEPEEMEISSEVNSENEGTLDAGTTAASLGHHCETLTIRKCQGLAYNATSMPNLLNHESQDVAQVELNQYEPLISVNCSRDIVFFLCSLHAPKCEERQGGVQVPPCRPLCERVLSECLPVMEKFRFTWPRELDCARFPDPQDPSKTCTGQ